MSASDAGQFCLESCAAAWNCLAVMPRITPVMVSLMPGMSEIEGRSVLSSGFGLTPDQANAALAISSNFAINAL